MYRCPMGRFCSTGKLKILDYRVRSLLLNNLQTIHINNLQTIPPAPKKWAFNPAMGSASDPDMGIQPRHGQCL